MTSKRYLIAIMSSSRQLKEVIENIAFGDDTILELFPYAMEQSIDIAKGLENKGFDAIIARGGTSFILRDTVDLPVLGIPVSTWDILGAIQTIVERGAKKILLPIYRNALPEIKRLESIFQVKIDQAIFLNGEELRTSIQEAIGKGYDSVIGGSLTAKIAAEVGLITAEMDTSKDTILALIDSAKSMVDIKRAEQEKTKRYQSIIDSAYEGIVAVDTNGTITNVNKKAVNLVKSDINQLIGQKTSDFFRKSQILKVIKNKYHAPIVDKIEEVSGDSYIASHFPIKLNEKILGGVSIYRDVSNILKAENEIRRSLRKKFTAKYSIEDIVYRSHAMDELVEKIKKYATTKSTVLIYGETGTGKELVAHSIHNYGSDRRGPFLSINCAALPKDLLESELFGYEEGAFTGARRGGKAGLFELANKGTIFLDEIGSTNHSVQARLLRFLQEREVIRIGSDYLIDVDARVIAATNKNLIEEIKKGNVREDLFFRLNVLSIRIPPLRDRTDDLPILTNTLTKLISRKLGTRPIIFPQNALSKLTDYSWPGNVRQLENFLERVLLLCEGKFRYDIFDSLYSEMMNYDINISTNGFDSQNFMSARKSIYQENKKPKISQEVILSTLKETNYNRTLTAKKLGMSRTTLWRKLKE